MGNKGLKSYTKQISQTIGDVAKGFVNVNKEDANMHLIIPLFTTLGPNPMELSLIWNNQDKDKIGAFGKGFRPSVYYDIKEVNSTKIEVTEADGSTLEYEKRSDGKYYSVETGLVISKDSVYLPGEGDYDTYTMKDQQGNCMDFDEKYTYYITSMQKVNSFRTTLEGLNMDNGEGAKVTFSETDRVQTRATYTQNGTTLGDIDFDYDLNQRLTAVKYYKESRLVKYLSITYSSNEITVKDEISKNYFTYTFTSNCVTKITEVINDDTNNAVQTSIAYEDRRTTLTDNDGRKVYFYFDNNNFPLFEIDEDGNAIETEYDETTKRLISQSSTIPTKKKLPTLSTPTIFMFTKTSGITTKEATINDPVLSGVLGTVYEVKGTGSLTYTFSTEGLGSDNITAVIWGKQKTAFTSSSKVKVTLTADGKDSDEFKKTVVDDNFDMMTLGVMALKSYSMITLTITLTGNAEIEIGGIQLLKKDFGSFYQYDENGNVTGTESGKGTVSNVYNSRGLQTSSVGKDSTLYNYEYDDKGNLNRATTAFGGKLENLHDSKNNVTRSVVANASGTKRLETMKAYNSNGRFVSSETDELGNSTKYIYDSFGKIKKITDALSCTTEYSYDAFDNLKRIMFNNHVMIDYTYDSQNKLIQATLADGTNYSFGYDTRNNLDSISMNGTQLVSFIYDSATGLITHQKYGESGDSFDFIYNTKHNIKEIKINGILNYQYSYDNYDQIKEVKDRSGNILKSYKYDNDGKIIEVIENGANLEYSYDSLGFVNQRKRKLGSTTIYESFDSILRSKGFSPDNLIGYLQGNKDFLGTIFNGSADLKNSSYICKPYNYKTNSETKLTYTRLGVIPCVTCGLSNPMSYNPPATKYYENSGCISFWFYPT
ncbi:MAG: hypothetical protein K2N64_03385, partial [Anaeroplasmataceae bacterium]|nr:hypothetical protein [Anaeroplasmataceae bacterium]